ncbi:hypothetical protein GCM10027056_24570 [Glaciibacter psychrotolerans]
MARFENAHNVTGVDHALPVDVDRDPLAHAFDAGRSGIVPDGFLPGAGSDPTVPQAWGSHGIRLLRRAESQLRIVSLQSVVE